MLVIIMPFSPFVSNQELRLPVEGQKLNLRGLEMIDVFGDNNLCIITAF